MQRTEKQEEGNFRLLHPVHLSSSYLGSLSQGLSAMADKQNLTIELLQTWHPTPVLLPGKSHGQRRLVGCSPWGCEELDTTERLHFRFSLSCTGEGNGNPLQCSCLENPRDRGAWWAAVYGVTQSRTRLKRLSSSSSMVHICILVTEMKHFNVFVSHLCFLFSEISGFFCPFLIGLFIVSY